MMSKSLSQHHCCVSSVSEWDTLQDNIMEIKLCKMWGWTWIWKVWSKCKNQMLQLWLGTLCCLWRVPCSKASKKGAKKLMNNQVSYADTVTKVKQSELDRPSAAHVIIGGLLALFITWTALGQLTFLHFFHQQKEFPSPTPNPYRRRLMKTHWLCQN